MSKRHLDERIRNHFLRQRLVLQLLGPRQVGKTTLLKRLFPDAQYFLLDNEPVRKSFETYGQFSYKQILANISNPIILDEIPLLSTPGRATKIIFDQFPDKNLIITGSSALNIKNKTAESLAGRKIEYHLYPLTFAEYLEQTGGQTHRYNIAETLTTGVISFSSKTLLFDLRASLERILTTGLYPFSKNARDEIGKSPKIYFHDVGLRNALINDFSSPFLRRDGGAIFENFIVSEFYKLNDYLKTGFDLNFWRTSQGSEVDLVLSRDNTFPIALEIKLFKGNTSRAFANRYPNAKLEVVTLHIFYKGKL